MIPKPLVSASIKPILLAILAEGENYGYEIIQRVQDLSAGRIQCPRVREIASEPSGHLPRRN